MADTPAVSPSWTVEGQRPGIEQGAGGAFVRGYFVDFVTARGLRGSVFVPQTTYSAPNAAQAIKPLIADAAARLESVQNLTG